MPAVIEEEAGGDEGAASPTADGEAVDPSATLALPDGPTIDIGVADDDNEDEDDIRTSLKRSSISFKTEPGVIAPVRCVRALVPYLFLLVDA